MLFIRELKRNMKSFVVTAVLCGIMIIYVVSMSKSMGPDIQQILDMKLPKQFQDAFGMGGLDFNNADGFFAMIFTYIYLFIAIYIAGVFAGIVSKEFSDKTAEYLFSLPLKRIHIIITKLSVAAIYFVILVLLLFFLSYLSFFINAKDSLDMKLILLMASAWFLGGLTFGALAFLLSSFFSYSKAISSITIALVMFMYMLQVIISVNDKLDNLKYISPFDWYKGSDIVNSMSISTTYSLIAGGVIIVSLIIGTRRYMKMDVLI